MFVVRFKEHLPVYIETSDRNCEKSVPEIFQIVRDCLIADLFASGSNIPDYICNRYRLPDVVCDKTYYIFKLRDIANFFPADNIFDKNSVVNTFKIIVYLRFFFRFKGK